MNEINERDPKLEEARADERENASRAAAEAQPEKKKAKKKRKRQNGALAIPFVAGLTVLGLALGMVGGYGIGRSALLKRLKEADAQIAELTERLESVDVEGTPAFDAFEEELTNNNAAALSELMGNEEAYEADNSSALVGDDGFEDAEPAEDAEPIIVAEYAGGTLLRSEVAQAYDEQLASFLFEGYDESEINENLLKAVLHDLVGERVLEAHARDMGVYALDSDDQTQIEADAAAQYAELLAFAKNSIELDGMTPEEADGAAKAFLQENEGITLEALRASIESDWWKQKLYNEITKDVKLTEDALQSAYQAELNRQKESFASYPDDYEFAQMNGEVMLYNLAGYRRVQLLQFTLDDLGAVDSIADLAAQLVSADAAQAQELRAQLDLLYAVADARAADAIAQLDAGADFEELLVNLGDDAGMRDANMRASGYYISENSLLWPRAMIQAAMSLKNPGDRSAPVRTEDGVCILRYLGEVPAGEVALDSVREAFSQQALQQVQDDMYQNQVDQWIEEVKPTYYPERMQ